MKGLKKSLKTLELDKILELLSREATLEDASEMALSVFPETDFKEVAQKLKNTEDAYIFMAKYTAPTFAGAKNVANSLRRAESSAVLSIRELIDIADTLKVIRTVKEWRNNCLSMENTSLEDYFLSLVPNKYLEDKINFAIKNEEELNDNASPELYDIRRKISGKTAKLRENLEKIIKGPSAKYLQEAIITQRDGRYVVPLKAEHKGQINGILHDTSSSGSTLFIEPMTVVETNNEIRVLKLREREEIERILAELSSEAGNFSDGIISSYNALVVINFIFAKAKLAYKMKAIVPQINTKGITYLKNARHPLIPQKSVVPITVELGKEYSTLVITGPNTGGKTVTLKTVGLLTLMTMCGLMIPCDDGSQVAVYSKVFADIGDEQSIEQSLSTFSSHMVNIISILDSADDDSLVLFDELCAGTDPIEGSALAKAILMRLRSYGSKTVATTHYPELKSYAIDTQGVENASCEFDVATLKPTYRLITGMPGRSNAFAISGKLGLGSEIIDIAKQQVKEEDLRFERVVASLEKARKEAENERREASKLRAEMAESKRKSDMREHELQVKTDKLMEQTRQKANTIIENARYKSSLLLNELEEMKKQMNAQNSKDMAQKARDMYKSSLKSLEDEANPVISRKPTGEAVTQLSKGDIVLIADINRDATVIDVKPEKNQAYVMSGSIKMWASFENLRLKSKFAQSSEVKKTRKVSGITSRKDRVISGEIDLRGQASDEAIMELDNYIDNAILSGLETIRIIHGKGTGVLRKNIGAHLRHHKSIESFRLGTFGEGETGVTIATLKN
ncbi:MAG: endonuclease MutS2 [Ruminococcaceae bacterium]|nr:endonuclease MutS2 [Oscillospiraceae bacterium]